MNITIQFSSILIAIINFLILYIVLKKLLFDPIIKKMNERNINIQKSIDDNNKNKELLNDLRTQYDVALKNQENIKKTIIDEYNTKGQKVYEDTVKDANIKAQNIKAKAYIHSKIDRQKAIESAQKDVSKISILIASKIIKQNIDSKKNQELANDFLKEVNNNEK